MINHHPTQIILGPRITDRAYKVSEHANYVVFKVLPTANKRQIKLAVEAMFEVKVEAVRTLNVLGKKRRAGRKTEGRTKNWKKAYVKLAEGSEIDLLESTE
jgi:large subunit ribosomal protein L23